MVIGGGITGSGIARDAAARGLKTLLVEKDDFAFGTSSRSSKLVHGGLRYLSYGNFKIVFESCAERYHLMTTVAPHIVRPLHFIVPTFKKNRQPRWLIAAGLVLYGLLSMFRNFRHFKIVSRAQMASLVPGIRTEDSTGGLSYYDCAVLDFRLVIDTLKSAFEQGAVLLNYCKVVGVSLSEGSDLNVVELEDKFRDGSEVLRVRGGVVINATGVWADDLLRSAGSGDRFNLKNSCGTHIFFDVAGAGIKDAIAFESCIDKRNMFVVPWQGRILLGTTDKFCSDNPDNLPIDPASVDYLMDSFNKVFPEFNLTREKIISAYSGVRPLIGAGNGESVSRLSRDYKIKVDPRGMVSITGGKLTTYRLMAKKLVDRVVKEFFKERHLAPCTTTLPISGGDVTEIKGLQAKITNDDFRHLIENYGSNSRVILDYIEKDPRCGKRISPQYSLLWAEIDYFIDYEFAQQLSDIFIRRTTTFIFAKDNGISICDEVARHMGKQLGWSEEYVLSQIAGYKEIVRRMCVSI